MMSASQEPGIPLRVLLVEDSEDDALLLIHELKRVGYTLEILRVETRAAMAKALAQRAWDLILSDYDLPKFNGPAALALANETNDAIPVVIVTGAVGEEVAVDMMKAGARDYVMKDNLLRLGPAVEHALNHSRIVTERRRADEALRESEGRLRATLNAVGDYVFVFDEHGYFVFHHAPLHESLYLPTAEFIGKRPEEVMTPNVARQFAAALRKNREGETCEYEYSLAIEGGTRWFSARQCPMFAGNVFRGAVATVRDITNRKLAEAELLYRTDLERIISAMSADFVAATPDRTDAAIRNALRAIGEFVGVARSYVFQLRDDRATMDNTHEWCAEGVAAQIGNLQNQHMDTVIPWVARKLRKCQNVPIPDVNRLPRSARVEKALFKTLNIPALVCVPMVSGGEFKGILGFDSVTGERNWSDDTVALLRNAANVIMNALERKRAEQALRGSGARSRTTSTVSPDAITVLDLDGRRKKTRKKPASLAGGT